MNNYISIKKARNDKGISINEIAKALKIDAEIIELLENNHELPIKFSSYRESYIKSIYKYLGYKVPDKNYIREDQSNNTKLLITLFFIFFSLIILVSLSNEIYQKFNNQISEKKFQKDEVFLEIENFILTQNFQNINHNIFLDSIQILRRKDYKQLFILIPKPTSTTYFKVQNIEKNTIKFGELLHAEPLILKLDSDFFIDISNINNIDKIIYRGIEFKVNMGSDFYLKNFEINKFERLL